MFLKNYLKVGNIKELFLKDRLGFLNTIIQASICRFPFQNVTSFGAFLPYERQTPGFRSVLVGAANGEGGLCGHLNNFMKLQLESIGFEAELLSGCFRRTGVPNSHFLVKVKIPGYASKHPSGDRKDRNYLVDVGCGIPLHEAVCIEDLPYIGRAGGLNYRFERVDDNTLQRVNEFGDAIVGKMPATFLSPQDYTIELTPRDKVDFSGPVHKIYSNPRSVFLHHGLYCFRFLKISKDDFEAVSVRGKDFIHITKETRTVQSFQSYEELRPILLKYFPMIKPHEIDLSIKHFGMPFEEALKMKSNSQAQ